jgi:hypothetical protein
MPKKEARKYFDSYIFQGDPEVGDSVVVPIDFYLNACDLTGKLLKLFSGWHGDMPTYEILIVCEDRNQIKENWDEVKAQLSEIFEEDEETGEIEDNNGYSFNDIPAFSDNTPRLSNIKFTKIEKKPKASKKNEVKSL